MSNLNLRICRRSKDNIILLWDLKALSEADRDASNVKVFNNGKELKIRVASSIKDVSDEPISIPDATGVCLINHEENNMLSMEPYKLTIDMGAMQQDIDVLPYGVLPDTEKDDREKHVQLMAWDKQSKRWRKVDGIQTKNGFAILIHAEK
jgi:hypothetical protein